MTKQQLTLIDAPPDWRLDERTRRVGRAGVAKARAALMTARRSPPVDEQPDPASRPATRTAKAPSGQPKAA